MPKVGNNAKEITKGLFLNEDPEKLFTDLREIGHGSFGAVYFARKASTKEVFALKKMVVTGKQAEERFEDIKKEVKILKCLKHDNIVKFECCYLRDHVVWLAMEYCLGSAFDILEVHKKSLQEDEIRAICAGALNALVYLHFELGAIHRDVKAGNVLLAVGGVVKLADFGSASLVNRASSFIGTPYWMAPEVITSMDEMLYDCKADVWSLGITCIELAEKKPPLFHMNSMAAMYHIAQSDSPKLCEARSKWSEGFNGFVESCLIKDATNRPTSKELLNDPFISDRRDSDSVVLMQLIERTKEAVRQLDQHYRMRKILINDHASEELEPNPGRIDGEGDVTIDSTSSNSNSLTSRTSIQSSDYINHEEAKPPAGSCEVPNDMSFHQGADRANDSALENFQTIKPRKMVVQEHRQHDANGAQEQMRGYKNMRKQQHKEQKQLENKQMAEMSDFKSKLDKEMEQLNSTFTKFFDKLLQKQQHDREKMQKAAQQRERKLYKQIQSKHESEMKEFKTILQKNYKAKKEAIRKSLTGSSTPKKEKEQQMVRQKEELVADMNVKENYESGQKEHFLKTQMKICQRKQLLRLHQLELRQLEIRIEKRSNHISEKHQMCTKQHESTQEFEFWHMSHLHRLKEDHIRTLHRTEKENQEQYNSNALKEMHKRHHQEKKNHPSLVRKREMEIMKLKKNAIQTIEQQYKVLKMQRVAKTNSKPEQKELITRLAEDQKHKNHEVEGQYIKSIQDMKTSEERKLNDNIEREARELTQKLNQELELLQAYQGNRLEQMQRQHKLERKQLEEKVSVRRILLEEKLDEEIMAFDAQRRQSSRDLHERQGRELNEFDQKVVDCGLDINKIAEESLIIHEDGVDMDELSIQGSMMSLSSSLPSLQSASAPSPTLQYHLHHGNDN
ncbi:DgyrCDS9529 [Dimorphilus gyrociliatus]|uniref:non-specific serine/threonine protein kinase n=1 Tax=Dimorphilus gyrociliatus TaxID=2664684 RepID=A0A7I8VYX3_9ANNE|nr:DgyrCDS9529 [Dimorphilus gyrociliatus]